MCEDRLRPTLENFAQAGDASADGSFEVNELSELARAISTKLRVSVRVAST